MSNLNLKTEDKILLTPANVKDKTGKLILSNDLSNILSTTQGALTIIIRAGSTAPDIQLTSKNGQVANADHIKSISGFRGFIGKALKDIEKESFDIEKCFAINAAQKDLGTELKKIPGQTNGQLSEVIRNMETVIKHFDIVNQWDDDDTITVLYNTYVVDLMIKVLDTLKEYFRMLLQHTNKIKDTFLEDLLFNKSIPFWVYEKLILPSSMGGVQNAFGFLFPKDIIGGIKFTTREVTDDDFINKNWAITESNETLISIIRKLITGLPQPRGRDAKRQFEMAIMNFYWTFNPNIEPLEMVDRYESGKFKQEMPKNIPEGESGQILREYLFKFTKFNNAYIKITRFYMFDPLDIEQFWKIVIKEDIFKHWEITQHYSLRHHVRELEKADFETKGLAFNKIVAWYSLIQAGYYNPDSIINEIEVNTPFLILTPSSLSVWINDKKTVMKQFINDTESDIITLQEYKAAVEKAADENKDPPKEIPYADKRLKQLEEKLTDLQKVTYDESSYVKYKDDTEIVIDTPVKREIVNMISIETVSSYIKKDRDFVSEDDIKAIKRLYKGIVSPEKEKRYGVGLIGAINEEDLKYLSQIKENERFGKEMYPKVVQWISTSFMGAEFLHHIVIQSVVEGMKKQDFFYEKEDEDV